jgi:hypothetical protein
MKVCSGADAGADSLWHAVRISKAPKLQKKARHPFRISLSFMGEQWQKSEGKAIFY